MPLNRAQIQQRAKALLIEHDQGLRWSEILRRVQEDSPDTPHNSIRGATFALFRDDHDIRKVSRGFYQSRQESGDDAVQAHELDDDDDRIEVVDEQQTVRTYREAEFYKPFADWLRDELGEVTEAVALGGALFRTKWGTPDVMGVLKPQASDLVKFNLKIVSAEIKIDATQPIVAFGQAVAYKLFSHKSFVVMPNTMQSPDLDRLTALCAIHGIGLITFKPDPEDPSFRVHVNALSSEPDMSFVNDMARQLSEGARSSFNKLF